MLAAGFRCQLWFVAAGRSRRRRSSGDRIENQITGEIVNFEPGSIRLQAAIFTSMGPSILLAERWGLKVLNPLLGLDHAKVPRAPVP